MKRYTGVILGLFLVFGKGISYLGTGITAVGDEVQKLDGPVTAVIDAGKGLVKLVKVTPKVTYKTVRAVAKAVK